MTLKNRHSEDTLLNPYIALTDLLINLVLVFLFFSASLLFMGRLGRDDIKYRAAKTEFVAELDVAYGAGPKPWNDEGRNDPAGTQRWVLSNADLFAPGAVTLSESGVDVVVKFSQVLKQTRDKWRRIRIEGHTAATQPNQREDWDLSARRAASVARLLSSEGQIPAHYLSVSARGGQNPLFKTGSRVRENQRVEIILEYAGQAATGLRVN